MDSKYDAIQYSACHSQDYQSCKSSSELTVTH